MSPEKEPRTKPYRFNLVVQAEMMEEIRECAKADRTTITHILQRAVSIYLLLRGETEKGSSLILEDKDGKLSRRSFL